MEVEDSTPTNVAAMTEERRKTRYARGQERRDALVDAAIGVIGTRGLERVSFRSVAETAGFPPSTTSYFFGSVGQLIDAAITRIAENVTAKVTALLDVANAGGLTRDDLADAIMDLVSLLSSPEDDDSLVQFEAYLAVRRRPELADSVHRIMRMIEEAAEAALGAFGIAEPHLPARHFLALIDGYTLHEIARPTPGGNRAELKDALLRVLDSYAPRG